MDAKEQIRVLSRGLVEFLTPQELEAKLGKKKRLTVKLGFDPTIADLHLGHTVVLQKLKQFQELGHQVVFLIGDFTAQIGDPSGQVKTRPALSAAEVKQNAKTYLDQAFKILDKKKTLIRKNSEWLAKMKSSDLVALTGHYNVARMLEREDFKKRYQEGGQITVREFLYPLLQGYDSVALKADVELGGSDQKFNLVVARDIQRAYGQEPEVIVTTPLLVGTDGQKKMSKSYGNYIGITESPKEMFGKIMSLSDDLMWHYYELLTDADLVAMKKIHPKEAKMKLGMELVARFHSKEAAKKACTEFENIFAKKERPETIPEKTLLNCGKEISIIEVLARAGLTASKGEARRLIAQGGVQINEERVGDVEGRLSTEKSYLIQVGKRRFLQVHFE